MKTYRDTLLAGVAALALVAGTGLASAQDQGQGQGRGTTPHAAQPLGNQGGGKMGPTGNGNRSAQNPNGGGKMGPAGNGNRSAQNPNGGGKMGPAGGPTQPQTAQQHGKGGPANAQNGKGPPSHQAQQHINRGAKTNRGGNPSTAQRQRGLNGLQGNASGQPPGGTPGEHGATNPGGNNTGANNTGGNNAGANVRLSEQQRTDIRNTVINGQNAPRVGQVDFNVGVGTVVPRGRIHVVPVPETLVRIEPRWRGFLYFVYEDEVVVVNPRNMRIVAVLQA